jgi:hypothetical protein
MVDGTGDVDQPCKWAIEALQTQAAVAKSRNLSTSWKRKKNITTIAFRNHSLI